MTSLHFLSQVLCCCTCNYTQHVGGLYAKLPKEKFRCVYFEAQPDPAKPIMRVAVDNEDDDIVKQSYPWERGR